MSPLVQVNCRPLATEVLRALVALSLPLLGFAQSEVCAGCHRGVWETYRRTGMARSFYRPTPAGMAEGAYYHAASDSYFAMVRRGSEYFQRRYQLDSAGRKINVMEKRVDSIM